ncbi:MAG: hypothetical protein K6F88_04625 [Ruminococcus sp.]|nr:hypothetical protein [Ruminococcus sp.]
MAKNLIILLVVLVVGLLAVWSWFTVNKHVEANTINVKAAYPNEIGLAEVDYDADGVDQGPKTFTGELNFNTDVTLTKDCTGDGETLIVPSFSVIKDKDTATKKGREVSIGGAWEEALSQVEAEKIKNVDPEAKVEPRYIEYQFYARSQTKNIYLTAGSYLSASDEHLTGANIPQGKNSSYGSFSSDSIVGAVRVALLAQGAYVEQSYNSGVATTTQLSFSNANNTVNYQRHLSCLWLPRPDIRMNVSNTGLTTDWTLTRNITFSGSTPTAPTDLDELNNDFTYFHSFCKPAAAGTNKSPAYQAKWGTNSTQYAINKKEGVAVQKKLAGDDEHFVVTSKSTVSANNYPTFGKDFVVSDVSESDNLRVSNLRKAANVPGSETNYYVYKYTLRIWLEGEDSESRRAMDGGQFRLHLEFR